MRKTACSFLILSVMAVTAWAGVTDVSLRLPVNAEVVSEDTFGSTWKQNAALRVTYVSAINQLKAVIGQQGWQLKQELKLGLANDRCLLVFERGKTGITVMVWKVGVSETGFSWGVNETKK